MDFDREATAATQAFFPGIEVRLHVPPPALADILKSGTLRVYEHSQQREFEALGHGAQRSIQMALIRMLAERKQMAAVAEGTRLLLINEPELYLHPQSVEQIRDALRSLTKVGYQVVFSTHSPLLVNGGDVSSTAIVFRNGKRETETRPTIATVVQSVLEDNVAQAELLFSHPRARARGRAPRRWLAGPICETKGPNL